MYHCSCSIEQPQWLKEIKTSHLSQVEQKMSSKHTLAMPQRSYKLKGIHVPESKAEFTCDKMQTSIGYNDSPVLIKSMCHTTTSVVHNLQIHRLVNWIPMNAKLAQMRPVAQ